MGHLAKTPRSIQNSGEFWGCTSLKLEVWTKGGAGEGARGTDLSPPFYWGCAELEKGQGKSKIRDRRAQVPF